MDPRRLGGEPTRSSAHHDGACEAGGSVGVQPHYWTQRSTHGGRLPALSTKDASDVQSQQLSTPAAAAAVLAGLHRQEYSVADGLFLAAAPPADLVLTRDFEAGSPADVLAFGSSGLASYAPSTLRRLPPRTLATVPFRVQLPGTPRAAVERMRRLEREYLTQAMRTTESAGGGAGGAGGGGAGGGSGGVFGDTAIEDVLCRIQCWAIEDVASPAAGGEGSSSSSSSSSASRGVGGSVEDTAAAGKPLQAALLSLMPGEEVDALARVSHEAGGGGRDSSSDVKQSLTGAAQLYAALSTSGPLVGTQHSQMQRYVLVRRARDGRVGFVPLGVLSLGSAPVALSAALPGVAGRGRP